MVDRRKLITVLAQHHAAQTAYYIDPSAGVNGSGTLSSPYNTTAEVNAMTGNMGGKKIYLKRGTTYEGQLSLTNASNFTVDAYGTGAKPILDGSRALSVAWTAEGSLWYTAVEAGKDYSRGFWCNGTRLMGCTNKTDLDTGAYKSWYDAANHRHYIITNGVLDPNSQAIRANSQETAQLNPVLMTGCHDYTISNLFAQRGYANGFKLYGNNGTIDANVALENGSWNTNYSQDGFIYYGTGYGGTVVPVTGVVIRNNISSGNVNNGIENWGVDGASVYGNSGDGNGGGLELWGYVTNSVYARNKFINNNIKATGTASGNAGRGVWATPTSVESPNTGHCSGNTLAYNIFMNSIWTNLWIQDGTGWKIYNNIFHEVPTLNYYTVIIDGTGITAEFSNNIVSNLHGDDYTHYPLANFGGNGNITLTGNNNNFWMYNGFHTRINYNGTLYQDNFAGFKTATGQTASINVDPNFTSSALATYDFSLLPGSAMVDAGVNVSQTTDYTGAAVCNPPEIGAYESSYVPASSLDLNFTNMSDGAISSLLGSFAVVSGSAVNSGLSTALPSLTELVTDGGFENWNSDTDLTSWTETVASTSTVNKESTEKHSGNYAVNLNINSSNSAAMVTQATVTPQYSFVLESVWSKNNVGSSKNAILVQADGNPISGYSETSPAIGNSTTMTQYYVSHIALAANSGIGFRRSVSNSSSSILYADDLSQKIIPSASAFDVALFSSQYGSIKVSWIRLSGYCLMGSVMCLDYPNDANYVIAYHDTINLFLKKCVNRTFSTLIKSATTYVAGANVMIKRSASGNIFQLLYGPAGSEAQVGADQTINDVTIIGNRHHGLFDLSPSINRCSRFIYDEAG